MKQRKRFTKTIHFRSSLELEAQMTIERDRLLVVLVHVDQRRAQVNDCMFGKRSPDTDAMPSRMDKQRFHLCTSDADESHERSLRVSHAPQVVEPEQLLKH